MRPIELSLSGLHSYKEQVDIDFTELGRYGLFGIFGRIGSGKSSLLDAMTLALYGLVDRISTRSRKGLINLASKTCEVRFRFAIDHESGADIYEVQRAFRDLDGAAIRTGSRLVQLTSKGEDLVHTTVLAEREADVTQVIEDIIGLGHDDFVRAVVLPQGKFTALLHLKGVERRQMLQRIFRLQAYGEDLRRTVRERLEQGRFQELSIKGELLGMGDASPEAIALAKANQQDAAAQRQSLELAHQRLMLQVSEAGQIRERHVRRTQIINALADHLALHSVINTREATVARATAARPLLALARRWLEHSRAQAEHRAAFDVAEAADRVAALAEQTALAAEATARDALETEGPKLALRLHRLEAASATETELARDRQALRALAETLTETEAACAAAEQSKARAIEQETAIDALLRKTRREYTKSRVSADERQAIAQTIRASELIYAIRERLDLAIREEEAAQTSLDRAIREEQQAQAVVDEAHAALALAQAALGEIERDPALLSNERHEALVQALADDERETLLSQQRERELAILQASIDSALQVCKRAEVAALEAVAERKRATESLRNAESAQREAEEAEARARIQAAASALASTLTADEPCPVCGSPHHPSPAKGGAVLPAAGASARAEREIAAAQYETALSAHLQAMAALETARQTEEAARRRQLEIESASSTDLSVLLERMRDARRAQRLHQEAVGLRERAKERIIERHLALERLSAPAATLRARREMIRSEFEGKKLARERLAAEADAAWVAFDRDRGALTLLEVTSAASALEARDRRCELLTQTQDALERDLSAATAAQIAARDALVHHHHRLEADRAAHAALHVRITEVSKQLNAITDGESASALAQALRPALQALQADAARTAMQANEARQQRQMASRDRAIAESEFIRAHADATRTYASLLAASSRVDVPWGPSSASTDLGDLWRAITSWLDEQPADEQLEAWQREITLWKSRHTQLEAQLEALGESADAALVLSDVAYAALEAELAEKTSALDAARERATLAGRAHAELIEKNPRWTLLTTNAARLDGELSRLDELTTLLRGDRFVEYVANDHLYELTTRASEHLHDLTGGRYGLTLDEELSFVVVDEEAAGKARPVHTLSGGESFLTALALALALSTKVQERSAQPLGFFFLDEGFGTLDPEALDRVMTSIEALRGDNRLIGLISHLPAIRERVPRYLWVEAGPSGSRIKLVDV